MQPQTTIKFDEKTFERLRKNVMILSKARNKKKRNIPFYSELPNDIGLQINSTCNLRCKTCFLWNDDGRYREIKKEKLYKDVLSVDVIDKVLKQTKGCKSNLFFWGTEPLLHEDWNNIAKLLENDVRWTVLCTNGTLIDKKIDSILRISQQLVILISLDGLKESHDKTRGKGSFDKTINNIRLLQELQKKQEFKGEISIQCVINDNNIHETYEFMEFAELLGVNSVYLSYPWYISENTASVMDEYFNQNFSWLKKEGNQNKSSWHYFKYHLNEDRIDLLLNEIKKVNDRIWNVRVRFQPAIENYELDDFIKGGMLTAQNRKECFSIADRIDILSDGTATPCMFFPEFNVGDINTQGLSEIWNSEKFNKIRETVSRSLMPVCSKCFLLYHYGK